MGRPADNGLLGIIEPNSRIIGLHLYDGLFKARLKSPTGRPLSNALAASFLLDWEMLVSKTVPNPLLSDRQWFREGILLVSAVWN